MLHSAGERVASRNEVNGEVMNRHDRRDPREQRHGIVRPVIEIDRVRRSHEMKRIDITFTGKIERVAIELGKRLRSESSSITGCVIEDVLVARLPAQQTIDQFFGVTPDSAARNAQGRSIYPDPHSAWTYLREHMRRP
jgi:hypothetical protein